jgi:transglutaminase-like putative cysteine protease
VTPKPVSYEQLWGIFACLALALLAHLGSLPVWVFAIVAMSGGLRLTLAHRGRPAPPRALRLTVTVVASALLFAQFRTFNGLSAGTALLALVVGLKMLETETQRDIYVVTLCIYFVSVSALLESTSFWLFAYLIAVCWLTTAALLRLTGTLPLPDWRRCLRYSGRLLGQALPLALALWLLFPRFAGPLWHIPENGHVAGSGMSDTMSPGDIDQLALSDEVAFRVHFSGATPPPQERYWRGPVLHYFDGRTWGRSNLRPLGPPTFEPQGPAYDYTVSLEPHQHQWLFALDWPSQWKLADAGLTRDYTLIRRDPVSRPIDVAATSHTQVRWTAPLSNAMRKDDTQTPPDRNPRTVQLAQSLRRAHPDDAQLVGAVLAMFTQQAFYYTLTPPKLADESVDSFLFDSKRGFCEHYASAFAMLMRAAGIPARVVTGYQGGTFNRFGDYWIVRQSDAHAWDEVWIEGRGWLRVDPTSAIAPERVELDAGDALNAAGATADSWQRRFPWIADARLRLDAVKQIWRERILFFDQSSQTQLLEWLNIPEPDGQKLVLLLVAALTLVLCWLTWTVRREVDHAPRDALKRAYSRLCGKLAAAGIPRRSYEGAEDYASRVARHRPDLSSEVTALCRQYSTLRYAAPPASPASPAPITVNDFDAAVRAFRPQPPLKRQDSPAS